MSVSSRVAAKAKGYPTKYGNYGVLKGGGKGKGKRGYPMNYGNYGFFKASSESKGRGGCPTNYSDYGVFKDSGKGKGKGGLAKSGHPKNFDVTYMLVQQAWDERQEEAQQKCVY